MRIPIILFSLIILGLVAFEAYANATFANNAQKLRLVADRATEQALQLNSSLGYGGLIHNFKNAVLRPEEPKYIDIARADGAATQALVKELETTLREFDLLPKLEPIKKMVTAYMERLDDVQKMHAEDMNVTQIDATVRYNDMAAIDATNTALAAIKDQKQVILSNLENTAFLQNVVGVATGLAALSLLFLYNVRQTQLRGLKALASANSDLANLNANLDASNGALKQFAGIASHDLRAPVRTVSMFTHAIIEEKDDPQAVAEYGQMILELTQKMQDLIASLLDFTRNGFQSPQYETVDLSALAMQIARDLDITAGSEDAVLTIDALPTVHCDRVLMARVFENLLSNSIKYKSKTETARVAIICDKDPDGLKIRFCDNGIGIEAKYQDRIFEPLQRLHGDHSEYTGVGIGLALAKAILEAHGGTIELNTEYEGGASFVISLPPQLLQNTEETSVPVIKAEADQMVA